MLALLIHQMSDAEAKIWPAALGGKFGLHLTQLYKHVDTAVIDDLHPTGHHITKGRLSRGLQCDSRFACGIIAHGVCLLGRLCSVGVMHR
jgi:hypothetical protein